MTQARIDLPYTDRKIGEHTYRCNRLLLRDWISLEALVIKLLGIQVLDVDSTNLEAYAGRIISRSTEEDHDKIFSLMGQCLFFFNDSGGLTHLTRQHQERWWSVYMAELIGVLGLFFEVQFSDFFQGLGELSLKTSEPPESGEKLVTPLREKSQNI